MVQPDFVTSVLSMYDYLSSLIKLTQYDECTSNSGYSCNLYVGKQEPLELSRYLNKVKFGPQLGKVSWGKCSHEGSACNI